MLILGLDPGLNITGFAFFESENRKIINMGVIKTEKNKDKTERLGEIYEDLTKLIEKYKPEVCAIEQIFFSNNVKTAISVSEARGVMLLAMHEKKIPIHEFTPSKMKSALTGNGRADKKSIQKMLMLELKLKEIPKPDDAADALSLALALSAELRYHRHLKNINEIKNPRITNWGGNK